MEIYSMAEPSTANTSTYYDNIRDRNEQYEKACIRQRKDCPKNFKERSAQTFHLYQIDDATQTETEFKDVGVGNDQADQSDIIAENFVEDMTSATIMTEGSLLDVSDGARPGEKGVLKMHPISKSASYSDIKLIKAKKQFFESNTASQKLSMIERAIQQNIYSTQQIKYRGVEMVNHINQIQKDSSNDKDNLELLFALKCETTSHMKVTCMSWNKLNRDVLAVGYGSKRNSFCEEGCVMLWSIRNPQYPEKLFKLSSSVTTVDFSSEKAEMMAVGLLDGRVLVFDTASQCSLSSPMLDSAFSPGRHMATVSKLHWVVDRHQGATERLVSISVDGSVLQWSVKKGLSALPLMTLKRSDVHMSKGKLPNIAFGLSMDFAQDNISYLTGSDDGTLYHCSRSYNEHPLSTVRAHTGPLTAIKFSPFLDNVFMTGSSDSSIKIHHIPQKQEGIAERLVIYPANLIGAVNDISWSPNESAIFALAAEDDRMELWDMSKSLLDPIISLSQKDLSEDDYEQKSRTVVQFSNAGDILVVGDDQGCVELYRLHLGKRSNESEHLSQILERLSKPKGFNGDVTK
jgi:WD40 repeat protein